jgi:hypothetical protein
MDSAASSRRNVPLTGLGARLDAAADTLAAWREMIERYLPGGRGQRLSTVADWERDRAGARVPLPAGAREHKMFTPADSEALDDEAPRKRERRHFKFDVAI